MSYIDKDKALNLAFKINVNLFESRRKTAGRAVQAYADAISAIPAADVRPNNTGAWELSETYKGYVCCPYCHDCYVEPEWITKMKWRYCPSCGSRLESPEVEE